MYGLMFCSFPENIINHLHRIKDKVIFLDQHAAHEKILYAQILDQLKKGKHPVDLGFSSGLCEEETLSLEGDFEDTALVASTLACKSAVRAGDYLEPEERVRLVKKLLDTHLEQYTCPHGRPTMIELSNKDLERMFKRN